MRVAPPDAAPRSCRPSSRDPGSGCRQARTSCSPGRSRDRIPSTRRRSRGRDACSSEAARPPRLAYPRASRRRLHPGRGRSGPDRDRDRRDPGHLDDVPGACVRLSAGVLHGRGGGGSRASRGPRRRHPRRRASGCSHPRIRPRELAARVPRGGRRDVDPLDDERDARRRVGRSSLRARAHRVTPQPLGCRGCRTRGRRGRRRRVRRRPGDARARRRVRRGPHRRAARVGAHRRRRCRSATGSDVERGGGGVPRVEERPQPHGERSGARGRHSLLRARERPRRGAAPRHAARRRAPRSPSEEIRGITRLVESSPAGAGLHSTR